MLTSLIKNNRGVALLVTIAVISLLIAVTLELNRSVRASVVSSAATRDRMTLVQMGASAVYAGMAMLVKDKTESDIDSHQENWADPEKIAAVLGDIGFESGKMTLLITDELARIQVNALVSFPERRQVSSVQQALWTRLLENFISQDVYAQEIQAIAIIDAIKDWLDSGDDNAITGLQGAESSYYQGLEPPYPCKNGPLDHIAELALIKGVTRELLYGNDRITGIAGFITTYGLKDLGGNQFSYGGKININTADVPVLTAMLPPEGKDFAQAIYDYRQETDNLKYIHDLSNPTWYKDVPGAGGIDIDPDLIATASDTFRLTATAELYEMKVTTLAVVKREKDRETGKWRCRILNYQIK